MMQRYLFTGVRKGCCEKQTHFKTLLLAISFSGGIDWKLIMKTIRGALRVAVLATFVLSFASPGTGTAQTVPPLVIRQIRVTGAEYVVLQATRNLDDGLEYWLGYVSNDSANPNGIMPTQPLPTTGLKTGEAILLTSSGGATCDAVRVARLSFELADTKGILAVRSFSPQSSALSTVDSVNWAKPGVTGTTTATLDLRKETGESATWYHDPLFSKPWRVGTLQGCELILAPVAGSADMQPTVVTWEQQAVEPLAIIESINEVENTSVENAIPGENTGLAPPLITEIVPNPLGAGTDAADEYIELYNSNDVAFDLGGFTLQTGLTTKHSYVFTAGTAVPARGFRSFYASETGLSMSNTSGQAMLLDRAKAIIAQSDPYDSAPDGQAWALANGTWYWTTKPTPAATNIIAQPIIKPATGVKKLTVKAAAAKTTSAKVKAATTKKAKTTKARTTSAREAVATTPVKEAATIPGPIPIHPGVLALVAGCAVGYGAYVYRKDLANAIYKLRRH